MRYIFLDWDGVINPYNHKDSVTALKLNPALHRYGWRYEPDTVKIFNCLERNLEFQIVFSSSIRISKTIPDINTAFKAIGISSIAVDKTNVLGNRDEEIFEWVANNNIDLKDYVVLDDEISHLQEHVKLGNVVKCSSKIGITNSEVEQIVKYFEPTKEIVGE